MQLSAIRHPKRGSVSEAPYKRDRSPISFALDSFPLGTVKNT